MSENLNISLTVEAWAEIVIKEWLKKVQALNINNTGALMASFENQIFSNASGDPTKVNFAFEWYGKMVDYGVGKYVSLDIRDALIAAGATRRRPKPWFTDSFYKQLEVLRHLLEEKHAYRTELFIQQNISDNADLGYDKIKV